MGPGLDADAPIRGWVSIMTAEAITSRPWPTDLVFDRETNETLCAYAQFIGESTEYVLTQVIDTVLGRDKEFLTWRAQHPESSAPRQQDPVHRHAARGR